MDFWTQIEIDECIKSCRVKAAIDEEFRRELQADPVTAIERETGRELPEGVRLKVTDTNSEYDAVIVLPDLLSGGLSDEQLDRISGGAGEVPFGFSQRMLDRLLDQDSSL